MATLTAARDRLKNVYFGWWVLASTFILGAMSGGVFGNSNAIFFGPVKADLGLTSAQTSLIFSLSRAQGSLAGPVVGWVVDRFGARPMVIAGGLAASLGFILLSGVHNYWVYLLIFIGVVSTGRSAGLGQTLLSAVNQWFIRRRSLAMSICITGFTSGGAVLLPLITLGVNTIGWRAVMLYSGIFMAVITLPLALLIRPSPESMGLEPDGGNSPEEAGGQPRSATPVVSYDFSVREALRTRTFWTLLIGAFLRTSLWGGISVHAVQILIWRGLDPQTAGFVFSLMFLLAVPMRLGFGALGQRLPVQPLLFFGEALAGASMACLLFPPGWLPVILFVGLLAVEQGSSTLQWVALGDYFGRTSFGTLMGIMSTCFNIGMLVAPLYAGWIFDRTSSYDLVLLTFLPMYGASAVLCLLLRRPVAPRNVPGRGG
ncbi:MAG TPA: MFS transporter [Dehalococcoidia bacterium]|nr:MFS transporter [Dehalococcoidia bacterium]